MYKDSMTKIKWCLRDVNEFIDLIEINDSETDLGKRYHLCQEISGEKIRNRVENLIIACWSAKDWIIKDITEKLDKNKAKDFERRIYKPQNTDLIQYLADSFKHGGIDEKFLTKNRFKTKIPKLEKTFLYLSNNSFPGQLKPFFRTEGDDVPAFDIQQVQATINGVTHYNFDTIQLSTKIVDKDNVVMGDSMSAVSEYVNLLTSEYSKLGLGL